MRGVVRGLLVLLAVMTCGLNVQALDVEQPDVECAIPPGVDGKPANYYSGQVAVLIRDEETDLEWWAYAYACVQDQSKLEDDAWANLSIDDTVEQLDPGSWVYQFVPNESNRSGFLSDRFSDDFFTFTAYAPTPDFRAVAQRKGKDSLVETVSVSSTVRLGVTDTVSDRLEAAGLIVDICNAEPNRVILLYSANSRVREAWAAQQEEAAREAQQTTSDGGVSPKTNDQSNRGDAPAKDDPCVNPELQSRKFISAWLNAVYLLCNVNRRENRAGDDEDRARTLMHRDPQYKYGWRLAEGPVDCTNPKKDGDPLNRKWGGGIAVYYLFPNLELGPLSVTYDGDYAVVTGTVINDSAATGDVSVYYKWTSDSTWQDNNTVAEIEPYQGVPHQGVTRAPASFTLRVKRPDTPQVLSVFLWPRDNTPLAAYHPDVSSKWAAFPDKYPEMLTHNEPWDENYDARWVAEWGDEWETELTPATHERQVVDNIRTILVQPGCDLSVQLTTPASTSQQGFDFQVHLTKKQCDATKVPLEVLVNGNLLDDELTFAGTTAYGEYNSGSLTGFDSALIEVRVDPSHAIKESDETNNIDQRLVPVEREAITCPSGVSPDECFRSKLNN